MPTGEFEQKLTKEAKGDPCETLFLVWRQNPGLQVDRKMMLSINGNFAHNVA